MGDLKSGAEPLKSPYVSVRLLQTPRVMLLTRTSEPFGTVGDIEQCREGSSRAVPLAARAGWRVIIDMRLAPTRVHPSLDPAFDRFRKETEVGFARVAVVVNTALGRVRAERLSSNSDVPLAVVDSLEKAVDFLNDGRADAG